MNVRCFPFAWLQLGSTVEPQHPYPTLDTSVESAQEDMWILHMQANALLSRQVGKHPQAHPPWTQLNTTIFIDLWSHPNFEFDAVPKLGTLGQT